MIINQGLNSPVYVLYHGTKSPQPIIEKGALQSKVYAVDEGKDPGFKIKRAMLLLHYAGLTFEADKEDINTGLPEHFQELSDYLEEYSGYDRECIIQLLKKGGKEEMGLYFQQTPPGLPPVKLMNEIVGLTGLNMEEALIGYLLFRDDHPLEKFSWHNNLKVDTCVFFAPTVDRSASVLRGRQSAQPNEPYAIFEFQLPLSVLKGMDAFDELAPGITERQAVIPGSVGLEYCSRIFVNPSYLDRLQSWKAPLFPYDIFNEPSIDNPKLLLNLEKKVEMPLTRFQQKIHKARKLNNLLKKPSF